ncbi:sodium/proton antiporter, CPA1 family [Chitinophaga costaii]|uniref:Sodium/proton antiporter, CPA1 family n=1 Tax=Chitinophaga costaii TaxID=1335309 RepID=A0A1C4CMW7_9BACT|nr:Na+/H+ antiporter [Chitinophaga costaii]PUZ27026.1 Na+/H+ antiporter [Chitinophaga costaii]SCC20400.1 sodium/proton antiporter, CPA1 family [Chitinophaga costaii]
MQQFFGLYLLLILLIIFLIMLAQKLRMAYPIVLVLGGLALSLIPGMPSVKIHPEVVFIIFLPPLLFEAAWNTSWKELWRWRRVISSFAFLIVIVTAFIVAIVSSYLLPGFTMALGFLLGGIISPPDAVSASAILKNVKAPRALQSIVEGESLLNDASSLIVFRFALIAVDSGRFVFHEAALSFVVVIVLGILCGLAIGVLYYVVHRWLPTTAKMDVVLTLTAPYVMYLVAEYFHVSGVLSVVAGGLYLSFRSDVILSHRSRLEGSNVWSTLGFVFNGIVFMLIGLQLPGIVSDLGAVSISDAIGYGLLISLILIVTRILCTLGSSAFTIFISRYINTADKNPGWRMPLAFGWAGMRGVVSLAAALSIPILMDNGQPFPQRNLILFITFVVIMVTLVVQGLTLPALLRWLHLEEPGKTLPPEEQEAFIRRQLGENSMDLLEGQFGDLLVANKSLQRLKGKIKTEFEQDGISDKAAQDAYQEVFLHLLAEKRKVLQNINKDVDIDEELIRKHHRLLDLEEEELRIRFKKL